MNKFTRDDWTVIIAWVILLSMILLAGIVNYNTKTKEYVFEPVTFEECESIPINNGGCDIHEENCAPVDMC